MNSQNNIGKAIIGKALNLSLSLALCLTGSAALFTSTAYADDASANVDAAQADSSSFSAADLDNLLAPIALYPDPLLAQVLVAATFDDQIQDASQLLSAGNVAVDDQPWDDSVKAVAHYPKVLFTLAAQPDWTTALGQAYVAQSTDVMNSIQRLRAMASDQGNLVSTQQQTVSSVGGIIQILPARVGLMFLPTYDPALVFSTPAFISFGPALAVDASCDDHIDWHQRRIFDGHNHYVRTGDRGRIRNVRGPVRGRFNPGVRRGPVARGPVNRGRYSPGFSHNPMNHGLSNAGYNHGPANHGPYNPGFSKTGLNQTGKGFPGSIKTGTTNPGSTKTGSKSGSTKTVTTKTASTKTASTKTASTKTAPTKTASTKTASTKTVPTKSASTKAGSTNTGSMNRGSAPAPRSSGRSGHR